MAIVDTPEAEHWIGMGNPENKAVDDIMSESSASSPETNDQPERSNVEQSSLAVAIASLPEGDPARALVTNCITIDR